MYIHSSIRKGRDVNEQPPQIVIPHGYSEHFDNANGVYSYQDCKNGLIWYTNHDSNGSVYFYREEVNGGWQSEWTLPEVAREAPEEKVCLCNIYIYIYMIFQN